MGSVMRPSEDKGCYSYGSSAPDALSSNSNNSSSSFEFHKGGGGGGGGGKTSQKQRKLVGAARAKPTPSKWDDAQKWLVGFSGGGDHGHSKNRPRNSNADDRRLLHSASQKGRDSCSSVDGLAEDIVLAVGTVPEEGETKKMDCGEAVWRMSRPGGDCPLAVRPVCVRDMGTEMTPAASQEPSRTATPIRATSPAPRSPISSRSPSPAAGRNRPGPSQPPEGYPTNSRNVERKSEAVLYGAAAGRPAGVDGEAAAADCNPFQGGVAAEQPRNHSSLESRAMAWDEAERAKYMARYKREEIKIQAWENHEKRKAEVEMKRMEVKAERLKARAQERLTNKLAATRRIAEEKRANAEAKLNERAARTSERADYIRRTGHLPSSFFSSSFFSFRRPSLCG